MKQVFPHRHLQVLAHWGIAGSLEIKEYDLLSIKVS